MPTLSLPPAAELFYRDDDIAFAWEKSEAIFLFHGNAESGLSWNKWMPRLLERFRVVRPDMRGFGQSTPMPLDHPWSIDEIGEDFIRLADHLGIDRFHAVAAKIGGPIALRLAAVQPARIRTLTVIGSPISGKAASVDARWHEHMKTYGIESWARETMPARLGSGASAEMLDGWSRMMGRTAPSTQIGFIGAVGAIDVTGDLPNIRCPTLVITPERSGVRSVEATHAWQTTIPHSELLVLPGDSYHLAASDPEVCARATLDFVERAGRDERG
ncbi:MAG: alpha/beta fold hydrolase [Alphaproteobacteria bacterium]|nr:alpha/beta fold hydrolase [Alphaproteobacteria bacterium]